MEFWEGMTDSLDRVELVVPLVQLQPYQPGEQMRPKGLMAKLQTQIFPFTDAVESERILESEREGKREQE